MSASRLIAALAAIAAAGAIQASAAAAGSGPRVQVMVVGASGQVLVQARTVLAGQASVRVGRRRCSVAAGTPLAALIALRRAGGPAFALRDYGRCSASPRDSGELFVYSLAAERNRGQDGWEYKAEEVAGSTGAGDPSGPLGDGHRLRSGERLLWFWCHARGGGCQRTLSVRASATTVAPGQPLAVTVSGYDNEGSAAPAAGATVTLGGSSAATAQNGTASVIAPAAPGTYTLGASASGLAPSFPETIVVG